MPDQAGFLSHLFWTVCPTPVSSARMAGVPLPDNNFLRRGTLGYLSGLALGRALGRRKWRLRAFSRPGHIQLRVLDMGAAIEHYTETLGLVETGRDDSGRVYFKAWDEFDHSCLILRQADSAGMDFMAFRVADNDCLRGFEQKLTDAGFEITHHPAGDLLATGERISFVGPGGHRFELFADKEQVGNGMSTTNPDMFPEGLKGMHPSRFDHCALQAASIDACTTLFTDIFGFNISEKLVADDGKTLLIFLSCSNKPHDIAFLVGPADDGKNPSCGLLSGILGGYTKCGQYHRQERRVPRYRSDPARADPRAHHLFLRSLG